MSKHTPTPWEVVSYSDKRTPVEIRTDKPLYGGASGTVLVAKLPHETVNARANAAHIVLCVNSHAELVEALTKAEAELAVFCDPAATIASRIGRVDDARRIIRAALLKASPDKSAGG